MLPIENPKDTARPARRFRTALSALRGVAARRGVLAAIAAAAAALPAAGDVLIPLASYEPDETDLTVAAAGGDVGLSVAIVPGGTGGAPVATDGDHVLKVTISGEGDRKVEFRHFWSSRTYDLAQREALLADVYIADAGALPGLVGIWDAEWSPPSAWQPAAGSPVATGTWTTITFDVSQRSQVGLDQIWAFVLENLAGTSGVAYVDNLRFRQAGEARPTELAALGLADRNQLAWRSAVDPELVGYNVYRALSYAGPFAKRNDAPVQDTFHEDFVEPGAPRYYYRVTAVTGGGESAPSNVESARYNGLTDAELLTLVQAAVFDYFWLFGHPVSGAAREGLWHGDDIVATGGTGMGLMAIVVGAERGFVTRADAAERVLQILNFFDTQAQRYHGAWAHWVNGATGATIPFTPDDDGADLVETSYFAQGLLTVRQYFGADDPVENAIRATATRLWEGIEWDWFRRDPDGDVLYWHWSPTNGWIMNLPIRGYNETMITYLLAIASPTHPVPASLYHAGWAGRASYVNGNTYYGIKQWVGPPLGGPLFFTHYTHLGFDPRYKRDAYANYFENSRNISRIHRAYALDNPQGFEGYNRWAWGLTASASPPPWYYSAHSPTNDNGTIAPTAALSAMPYTPEASLATMRYFYDRFGTFLFGSYGFFDAFNETENWVSDTYLAIDQGPIVVMIENYRTGLCWDLFMANPEIGPMMHAIGMLYEVDFDGDGDVDGDDFAAFEYCVAGPGNPTGGCPEPDFGHSDLTGDDSVDLADVAVFQTLVNAPAMR